MTHEDNKRVLFGTNIPTSHGDVLNYCSWICLWGQGIRVFPIGNKLDNKLVLVHYTCCLCHASCRIYPKLIKMNILA